METSCSATLQTIYQYLCVYIRTEVARAIVSCPYFILPPQIITSVVQFCHLSKQGHWYTSFRPMAHVPWGFFFMPFLLSHSQFLYTSKASGGASQLLNNTNKILELLEKEKSPGRKDNDDLCLSSVSSYVSWVKVAQFFHDDEGTERENLPLAAGSIG